MNEFSEQEKLLEIKTFDKQEILKELYEKLQQLRSYAVQKDRVDELLRKIEGGLCAFTR